MKADSAAVETARLNLSYTVIPAPITGRTGALLVRQGNLVKANASPLVVINQIHPILVRFPIQGRDLPLVQKYQAMAPLQVSVAPAEGEEQQGLGEENGVLTFVDNAVDPQTGTVLLKARFDNADRGLWPGEYVTVHLQVYVQQNAISVPASAPVTQQDGSFVYVVADGRNGAPQVRHAGPDGSGSGHHRRGAPGRGARGHRRAVPAGDGTHVQIKAACRRRDAPADRPGARCPSTARGWGRRTPTPPEEAP